MKKFLIVLLLILIVGGAYLAYKGKINIPGFPTVTTASTDSEITEVFSFKSYYSKTAGFEITYPDNYTASWNGTMAVIYKNDSERWEANHYPRDIAKEIADSDNLAALDPNAKVSKNKATIDGIQTDYISVELSNTPKNDPSYFVKYIVPDGKYLYVISYSCVKKTGSCAPAFEKMIQSVKFASRPAALDTNAYTPAAAEQKKQAQTNRTINQTLSTSLYLFKTDMMIEKIGKKTPYTNVCGQVQTYMKDKIAVSLQEDNPNQYGLGINISNETFAPIISKITCKASADKFVISVPVTLESGAASALCVDATDGGSTTGIKSGNADFVSLTCK